MIGRLDRGIDLAWAIGLALAILLWPAVSFAAKTDLVVLNNGDRITGEVKSLSRGKLDYSTDDAGRLTIEWVKVARVTSPHLFEVEVASGAKYFGELAPTDRDGTLAVQGTRTDTLPIPSVVRISALNAEFFQRVRAFLDLGLTFAKANRATTFNASGETAYRGNKFGSTFSFDSYAQAQESAPTTSRNKVGLNLVRYLPKRWSTLVLAESEQNDELNLDLRWTAGGVLARTLVQSNSSELVGGAGLALTWERFLPDSGASGDFENNLEALLAAEWDAFRFDSPSLDFSTSMYLFPSLTTGGRVRGEFNMRLKYELLSDFNVGVSLTDNFDSKPPESASKNDYITTFTIGWSYRR